jgi:hypothetical protein
VRRKDARGRINKLSREIEEGEMAKILARRPRVSSGRKGVVGGKD